MIVPVLMEFSATFKTRLGDAAVTIVAVRAASLHHAPRPGDAGADGPALAEKEPIAAPATAPRTGPPRVEAERAALRA